MNNHVNTGPFQTQLEDLVQSLLDNDEKVYRKCDEAINRLLLIFRKRGQMRIDKNQSIWAEIPKGEIPIMLNEKLDVKKFGAFLVWLCGWHIEENGINARKKYELFVQVFRAYLSERELLSNEKRLTSDSYVDLSRRLEICASSLGRWMDICAP